MTNLPVIVQKKTNSLERLSPLQLYLLEIAKYPLLTPQQELELSVKYYKTKDIETAHKLVTSNLRLVVKIANEFYQAHLNIMDLIQEGNTGLMQAVKKFNPYKGVKLSTYASWWIKAYILKFIITNKSQVKIGTTAAQRKLFFKLKKESQKLLEQFNTIDTKLLAANLDVKEKDVIEMQKRLNNTDISLDTPLVNDNTQTSVINTVPIDEEPIDEKLANLEIQNFLKKHLNEFQKTLTSKELKVFEQRLLSENPKTLQEIGSEYGITRERVRQIESSIIGKLKHFLKTKGLTELI